MMYQDAKQAIIEFLSNPPETHVQVMRQEGEIARASAIRFLKERSIPHYQLYLVAYEAETGQQRMGICFVKQDEAGLWQLRDYWSETEGHALTKAERDTSQPWVQLGGFWGKEGTPFYAGGRVIDHGFGMARVRLISSNGQVLEDHVEYGFVLFLTEREMQRPIEAELYDRSGVLVGKQVAFPAWHQPE